MSRNTHNRQLDHHGTDLAANVVIGSATPSYSAGSDLNTVVGDLDSRLISASWKAPCRVATTGNVDLATGLAAGQVIDGVTLATGDRVLVRAQTAATENGIYVAPASGAASRATDADTGQKLAGAATVVREGSTLGDTIWIVTTNGSIAIGTTAITWGRVVPAAGSSTTTSAPGDTTSQGTATEYARTDHRHGRESFATTAEIADVASTEAAGTSGTVARGDHVHRLGIGTTKGDILAHDGTNMTRLAVGANGQLLSADSTQATGLKWTTVAVPSPGSGTTSSAPGDATAQGTSSDYARTDHKHGRESWGTSASASAPGNAASAGTATTVARSDHVHGRESFATTTELADVGSTESAGTSGTVPRGDHVHRLGIATTKGDLLVSDGTQVTRLPVGTDGQVLTADSAQAAGLAWAQTIRLVGTDAIRVFAASGDAQPTFVVDGSGGISLGPGGSTAPDLTLRRVTAGQIVIGQGSLGSYAAIHLGNDTGARGLIDWKTGGLNVLRLGVFDSGGIFREAARLGESGGAPTLSFFGKTTPVTRSSYGAPTGTATRTAFDTSTVTVSGLAERVKAIIDDLRALGLFG